jgi:PAS domain S-box-containing protein
MTVTPLKGDKGGAVVVHNDITDRELAAEAARESKERLAETLDQLQLAASAANVGMWTRTLGGEISWVSEKAGEIWGFPPGEHITQEKLVQNLHPDDRPRLVTLIRELEAGGTDYQIEYRVILKGGNIRWIHSRGKLEAANGNRIVRGAIVDITKLKTAEEAIHALSHKLMTAQEKERARLARELHDDLSQSIALLSIQLTTLSNDPKDLGYVKGQLDKYVSEIERLGNDVHRISHELHPAKLTQLGLEAALGGFCRELAAAHPLEIDFEAADLPRDLPQDISLCLYRVVQESLRNIVKHSEATSARVAIRLADGHIRLSVSDDGKGFDPSASPAKEALGLISIDERVRAVNGEAKVTSAVGAGTTIDVQVPVTFSR